MTPLHVALFPPNVLELEVAATGYETVSWLINGTAMYDFERLTLENYNKRLIIANTTNEDYGIYSADVHTLQNEILIIDFFVYKYGMSTMLLLSISSPFCLLLCSSCCPNANNMILLTIISIVTNDLK